MTGHTAADCFEQILEMVAIGSVAQRPIQDWQLSRYACYHTAELAANLFCTTHAEDKLPREDVRTKDRSAQVHK